MKICPDCGEKYSMKGLTCPSCGNSPQESGGFPAFAPGLAKENEGFEPEFFERLFMLESRSFWFRSRNKLILWAVKKYFPNAKNFLEIGCGTGFVLSAVERAFPQMELYGSEIYSAGLAYADSRVKEAELFQMDARNIPFAAEFDLIGAFDVLEHIDEDELVLKEMYRAVKRKGGIILTVPQHRFLWSKVDEYARHVRRYSAGELKKKVEGAGFNIRKTTSFVSVLLPLVVASRSMKKHSFSEDNSGTEHGGGGLLSGALERILDLERLIIRAGLTMPAGSSLLMVAEKL